MWEKASSCALSDLSLKLTYSLISAGTGQAGGETSAPCPGWYFVACSCYLAACSWAASLLEPGFPTTALRFWSGFSLGLGRDEALSRMKPVLSTAGTCWCPGPSLPAEPAWRRSLWWDPQVSCVVAARARSEQEQRCERGR